MECPTGEAAQMNSRTYGRIAEAVVSRGGPVNRAGQEQVKQTGNLHPFVDPLSGPRVSRNSMTRRGDRFFYLPFGIARQILDAIDSTYSFLPWFAESFLQTGPLNGMVQKVNPSVNWQSSVALVQDKNDHLKVNGQHYDRQVAVMQTQYEADENKLAAQIQQLMPSNAGLDNEEDYQLFMALLYWGNEADSLRYGLKPYAFLTADEIGRDWVESDMMQKHLGIRQQSISTRELGQMLVEKVHFFYLYVSTLGDPTTRWWTNVLGKGRVVSLSDARYGAATKAALVYVTENPDANRPDVIDFLRKATESSNYAVSNSEASRIYDSIERAGVIFGAQPKVADLPQPGDVFDHPRNPWPIGHKYYQPYKELGLPDPDLGIPTPFTPIAEAQSVFMEKPKRKPNKSDFFEPKDGDSDIDWGEL